MVRAPFVFVGWVVVGLGGLIHTKFDEGASSDPNGPDDKDFSPVPTWLIYRRYYDLDTDKWMVEQIRVLNENRRQFLSIGTAIPGKPYLLPAKK